MSVQNFHCPVPPVLPACGACESAQLALVCTLPVSTHDGDVPTPIWKCDTCGTYIRGVDYNDMIARGHFEGASYTDLQAEDRFRLAREDFFHYLITLGRRYLVRSMRGVHALDIGCSYGHFMDQLAAEGAVCSGVEIVDNLRRRLLDRHFQVYRSVEEIESMERFDLITAIDSLYCFEKPYALLERVHGHLAPDGVLIIRITNRTPLLNLLVALNRPITNRYFGDAKHNFSFFGVETLLIRAGFRIQRVHMHEKGKRGQRLATWLYYRMSLAASVLSRKKLTPGMILICRRSDSGFSPVG